MSATELNDIALLCKLKELSNDYVVEYEHYFIDDLNSYNLVIEYCDVIIYLRFKNSSKLSFKTSSS